MLLVGGGPVAVAKHAALLAAGARVTVVAPLIADDLRVAGTTCRERAFQDSDLDDVWFVVAAAPAPVNRAVYAAAERRRLFVNAVDDPAAASAYAAATIRRGDVTIAVSTGGDAPALAGLVREGLEAVLPEDLAVWVDTARAERLVWREAGIPMTDRRPLLLEALNRLYEGRRP